MMIKVIQNCLFSMSLITIALSGAVAETIPEYPQEYAQTYLQDCQETSLQEGLGEIEAKQLCGCTLREFQHKYSLAEFKQLNVVAETDENASNQLIEVGQYCFEELLYE